jgi:hypothetical protein
VGEASTDNPESEAEVMVEQTTADSPGWATRIAEDTTTEKTPISNSEPIYMSEVNI